MSGDTIAAIATAPGMGAVALLRLSGPDSLAIAARVFSSARIPPYPVRTALLGYVKDSQGAVVDQVLATYFPAPASYTGEDVIEIACHGGVLVTRRVLDTLLEAGARAAEPGEFTQRAFLNGKMDLTQAEAVMDLISAQTDLALKAAREQLEGKIGEETMAIREDLLGLLAHLEAHIDFPEEDIDPSTGEVLRGKMQAVVDRMNRLLATADQGRILREGALTVIYGAPNAGKSSLLNRLLGFDRAIVSSIAGTTRDTIEETLNLRGLPLRIVDTAGVRVSDNEIEREGVARARLHIGRADLLLEIVDGSQPATTRLDAGEQAGRHVLVLNKSDLPLHADWDLAGGGAIQISCKTGSGLEDLREAMWRILTNGKAPTSGHLAAINARHQSCLERGRAGMLRALGEFDAGSSPEFVALDLRAALDAVGEVVGKADTEEVLGVIFGQFCIGK